jgi:hypothetical protein
MATGNSVKHYTAPKIDITGKRAIEVKSNG